MSEKLKFFQAGSKDRPYNFPSHLFPSTQSEIDAELENLSMDYANLDPKNRRTELFLNVGGQLQKWIRSSDGNWTKE